VANHKRKIMVRLNITAEGYTEDKFIRDILAPHLFTFGIIVHTRLIKSGKKRSGGYTNYRKLKFDIEQWIKEDRTACHTTMLDLYGLDDEFPGYTSSKALQPINKVTAIESAFGNDINHRKFIPYIQLYEFEALLFSAPKIMEDWLSLYSNVPANRLSNIRDQFTSPEHINDNPLTAPSKRIISIYGKNYDKVNDGILIAKEISLKTMREECKHFDEWLTILENLK